MLFDDLGKQLAAAAAGAERAVAVQAEILAELRQHTRLLAMIATACQRMDSRDGRVWPDAVREAEHGRV